eukprot:m.163160 g.163160  ORF g.163160 m.163160 type:complete len:269 (-) comp15213_c1_seq2:4437-5243(-)
MDWLTKAVTFNTTPTMHSVGVCFGLSTAYVASLYLVTDPKQRNAKPVIYRRMYAVLSVTVVSPLVLRCMGMATSPYVTNNAGLSVFQHMGISNILDLKSTLYPVLLNMILFAGPLLQHALDQTMPDVSFDIYGARNLVIAPITEEIVFRACMIPLLRPCISEGLGLSWIPPLFFGVAHIHHILEGHALNAVMLQFCYTTVFGAFTSYVFWRTNNIAGPILCHAFSNMMGFPNFDQAISHPRRYILGGTYVAGLVSFFILLRTLTPTYT